MDIDQAIRLAIKHLTTNQAFQVALGHFQAGNVQLAERIFKEIVTVEPNNVPVLYFLGDISYQYGNYDDAIKFFKEVIHFDPTNADAYYNLGNVLKEKGQVDKAIECYQKAIELNPTFFDVYNNLGLVLQETGKLDGAIICYEKAIQRKPDYAKAYYNMGVTFENKNQLHDAITCYQNAINLNPNFIDAHWNISLALLLSENFREGWKEYEWRREKKDILQRDFPQPLWDGSDITGLTILLIAEQGLGDTIQFIRYARLVAQRGAKVIVECYEELTALIRYVKGVQQVLAFGKQLPEFDVYCPLLSLPLVFDTTLESIPARVPYISPDSVLVQKWKDKVQNDNSKFKVGLVWSGSPYYERDSQRSCSLDLFSILAKFESITFYSLQKGEAATQAKNPPKGIKLVDYTEEIKDFSDTAALIENLDLIISVDTAVAHLAGALGKPVWTLIPFAPDWRWLLKRQDSPWYPTMRLFRQPSLGDWETVMDKVKDELSQFLGKNQTFPSSVHVSTDN